MSRLKHSALPTPANRAAPIEILLARQEQDQKQDRRQRKVTQTMAHITQVAWAMFEIEGYDKVSMEAISARADIAKATLYKYFPSKEFILDQHFKTEMQQQKEEIQTQLSKLRGLTARLSYLFEVEANYLRDKHVYLAPVLKHRTQSISFEPRPTAASGMLTVMIAIFSAAQDAGELPQKHSAETLAHYLNAMRASDLLYWQANPQTSLLERHQGMLKLFLHGVLGDHENTHQTDKEQA